MLLTGSRAVQAPRAAPGRSECDHPQFMNSFSPGHHCCSDSQFASLAFLAASIKLHSIGVGVPTTKGSLAELFGRNITLKSDSSRADHVKIRSVLLSFYLVAYKY